MSHPSNYPSGSTSNAKPPVPAHFQAPLPVSATAPKEYNPTYVAPSPLFMTGVPGTFGAGWDGNGPGSFQSGGGGQQHPDDQAHSGPSYETARQIATLQSRLDRKLGPEYVSQRAGPGGSKLTYIEGWKVINVANEVFGFNGWSSTIQRLETDFCDVSASSGRVSVGISAIIRITLRDGTVHEDVGYGEISNVPSKAAAFDKCKKEAITDGIKRALRSFGNVLGNCLYDKEYTKEINKMKTPQPRWDPKQLYRRPEFDEFGSRDGITTDPVASTPQAGPSSYASTSSTPTPAHTARSTSYANTPAPHYSNNNLARSAMSNNHNQHAAASSSKGSSDFGGGRPNLPPTPVSLPRANTAPVPAPAPARVVQAKTIDECVPMEPTPSQQIDAEMFDDLDMSDLVFDIAPSSTTGGAGTSSATRRSASQEASDDTFIAKTGSGTDVKPRPLMAAPPPPIQRAATTTLATSNATKSAPKPDSSPAEPSSVTSSGDSTASNSNRPAQARPPARVGGFNYPAGHTAGSSNAAPAPAAMKRNHSVAVAGGSGHAAPVKTKAEIEAGQARRAASIATIKATDAAQADSLSSFAPASKVRTVLGELPLEGGDEGSTAKKARVEYGTMG